jgi:ABC-type lipoprotein release transport system permease subunit
VLTAFLTEGMRVWSAGILVGLALASAAARLIENQLGGISATDPRTLIGVAAVVSLVSATASLIPSWRGTRVNPVSTLRLD